MHLPAQVNSLSVQTFMANKTLSDSDSDERLLRTKSKLLPFTHVTRTGSSSVDKVTSLRVIPNMSSDSLLTWEMYIQLD